MIDELGDVIVFLSHASAHDRLVVGLFAFILCVTLLLECLWLRERSRNHRLLCLENSERAHRTIATALATFMRVINVLKSELSGNPIWTVFKKASSMILSNQKDTTPRITESTQATGLPISRECNTTYGGSQSKVTSSGEHQSIKGGTELENV